MYEPVMACLLVFAVHCGILKGENHIQANCNDDVKLPCTARDQMANYRYIVWFRDKNAIIKRKSNIVTFFNNSSPASLGVRESLVLQNVQVFDSGKYQCSLGADIGGRDMDSIVSLSVSECVTVMPACVGPRLVEVSALWTLLGFLIISVAKVVICSMIILVCKLLRGHAGGHRREEKQKHRRHANRSRR